MNGSARVKPTPTNPKNNASIREAVRSARRAAIPAALNNGRGRAATLAKAAGVRLIDLIAIAEAEPSPFLFPGTYGEGGTFGPGRYCGTERRPVFRVTNGKRRRVGFRKRRVCRVPPFVSSNLTMVFSTD